MKKTVCFYFQVHQPWRLSKINVLNINKDHDLFKGFGHGTNEKIFHKVAEKCYYPTNKLLLKLIRKYPDFKCSFSISGVFIEQARKYDKKVLKSFKKLVDTGSVELLNETFYHSLSWVFSKSEFIKQIKQHRSLIWQEFKRRPVFFRNTELIYSNEVGNFIRHLGFKGIVAEGWDAYMQHKNPNFVYNSKNADLHPEDKKLAVRNSFISTRRNPKIRLLVKNYKLSDDIAFRFSNKSWEEHPLTVEKFADWVEASQGNTVNIFIDYETFGEHQWESTGIFKFMEHLPKELLRRGIGFKTPSETIKAYPTHGEIDVHNLHSWADEARDLSAWTGNQIQDSSLKALYDLEHRIIELERGNVEREEKDELIEMWRRLTTSDHFYYMCTKYWSDGDVHKYFSPYETPYEAYINFMNCLNDLVIRLDKLDEKLANKSKK